MSNIYIQEPPATGKVLLKTTVGEIDIELWCREAPKACRNFIQLCLEGYYDATVFHRIVKGFIAQGGDPSGDGTGGQSIYGKPFKDEFHSRLRFVRRGLVAMANAGKDDNGSQFFFTLAACPELQNKHTIFGKVAGDTLYNMLKLEDCDTDHEDRPVYPHKILSSKVLLNPFDDIEPRNVEEKDGTQDVIPQEKKKIEKNLKLLSFGEEIEEEENIDTSIKIFKGKSKSSHDLTNDPKLSSVSVASLYEDDEKSSSDALGNIRKKLQQRIPEDRKIKKEENLDEYHQNKNIKDENETRNSIKKEIIDLKKELRKRKHETEDTKAIGIETEDKNDGNEKTNPLLLKFHADAKVYKTTKSFEARQEETKKLLSSFKSKLSEANSTVTDSNENDEESWLVHEFHSEEIRKDAKDANIPTEDRYHISDPRNPINKRRREKKNREPKK